MVFVHYGMMVLMSVLGPKDAKGPLEIMKHADGLRRVILEGDVLAAEALLSDLLGKHSGRTKSDVESILPGGAERLLPFFSAITFADRLLADDASDRRKNSERFVKEGYFRKFGITGKVAPKLLAASLQWMEGDDQALLREVKKERRKIARETDRLLRPLYPPKTDQ